MPKYDEKTSRGWPLPHEGNKLLDDVRRLREALYAIDADLTKLEEKARVIADEHVAPVEQRQDLLDTRMDVIAGQTTEDTEILDARIDAKGQAHPNLGHNVRSLHGELISLGEELADDVEDFSRKFQELKAADEAEISAREAAINQEAQTRESEISRHDEELAKILDDAQKSSEKIIDLQSRTDDNANGILSTALSLHYEANKRRAESSIRAQEVSALSTKLNAEQEAREKADADLQTSITKETQEREKSFQELDKAERETFGKLTDEIAQRTEQAEKINEALAQESSERESADNNLLAGLTHERNSRQETGEFLRGEIDTLADAVLAGQINFSQVSGNLKAKILEETKSRKLIDDTQAKEISTLGKNLNDEINAREKNEQEISKNLSDEISQRKQIDKDFRADLDNEGNSRRNITEFLRDEINTLANAILTEQVTFSQVSGNLKAKIQEHAEKISTLGENLTAEIHEREELRADFQNSEAAQHDTTDFLKDEINTLAEAVLAGQISFSQVSGNLKAKIQELTGGIDGLQNDLTHEAAARIAKDNELAGETERLSHVDEELRGFINFAHEYAISRGDFQQEQINDTAGLSLENALKIYELQNAQKSEKITREKETSELGAKLQVLTDDTSNAINLHGGEISQLHEDVNDEAAAILANTATLSQEITRRKNLEQSIPEMLSELDSKIEKNDAAQSTRTEKQISQQAKIRQGYDAGLQEQINTLSDLVLKKILDEHEQAQNQKSEKLHELEKLQENLSRLQDQINENASTSLKIMLNDYESQERTRTRLNVIEEALTDGGEINNMLSEIFSSGNNAHTEPVSSGDDDVDAMLDEIFNS